MLELTELHPNDHPDFDGHETIVRAIDMSVGLHALIGVHNTVLGPSLGGCRIRPYTHEDDALTDVLRLSRGMTYKSALAGLPLGGGKAVILADPKKDKTDALFHAFGTAVEKLGGRYITAEDVGSNEHDMILINTQTSYVSGLPVAVNQPGGNPSPFTALGVFSGIQATLRHHLKQSSMNGLRVAVQGLGSVGFSLCEQLHAAGADLIVTDVDAVALKRAQDLFGARVVIVAPDDIYKQDVDVFSPCALGAVLNDITIPMITAKIIAGAANNQLARPHHDKMLKDKDILYAPDYVINAGGVIAVGYEYFRRAGVSPFSHGMTPQDLQVHVIAIGDRLKAIYQEAENYGMGAGAAADKLARTKVASASR
jgi:leucine dehydrogenase